MIELEQASRQKQTRDLQSVTKCVLLKQLWFVVGGVGGNDVWKGFTHTGTGKIVGISRVGKTNKVLPTEAWAVILRVPVGVGRI